MGTLRRNQLQLKLLRKARGLLPESLHSAGMRRQVARVRRKRGLRDQGLIRGADFVFVSHPKSGRTWLRTLISRLYQERYGLPTDQILEFDNFHRANPAIPIFYFTDDNYIDDVSSDPAAKVDYVGKRVVLLVRHPIDVAVSIYHHHSTRTSLLKKDLNDIPYAMGEHSMFDYVYSHPQGLRHVVDFMNSWARVLPDMEELLLVRYEELHAEPVDSLRKVMDFVGAEFSADELERVVSFGSAENLRKLGSQDFFKNHRLAPTNPDDPNSHKVRRAKVHGYRDDFKAEELKLLEEYVRVRLAPSLGYRRDD